MINVEETASDIFLYSNKTFWSRLATTLSDVTRRRRRRRRVWRRRRMRKRRSRDRRKKN